MTSNSRALAGFSAISVLLGVLALILLLASAPFLRAEWAQEKIQQDRVDLLSLRGQLASEVAQRKADHDLNESGSNTKLLLDGETTGISGANLQRLIGEIVRAHGGSAKSFQVLPPETEDTLIRIALSLSISVDMDALRDILYDIEAGTPMIFIDDISIKPKSDSSRTPDPYFLGPLDVTIQVSGYEPKKEGT